MERMSTYSTNVFLVKLRPNNRRFDVVFDIRHPRKATQRRRKRLLDMTVSSPGHFDFQSSNVQIGEHAIIMRAARIVERDLRPSDQHMS